MKCVGEPSYLDYSVDTIVHFIQMFHDDSRARFRKQYSTNTAFQNDPGLHVWYYFFFKISQIFVTFVSMISANNKIANFLSLLAELTPTSTV